MTRLTVRQFRTQALVIYGALAALAVFVIISGLQLRNLYPSNWQTTCDATESCGSIGQSIRDFDQIFQGFFDKVFLLLLPVITGIFWGAPLVARELETGTYRLAWTQSTTRTRWFATKVAIVGLSSVAATGLLSLMVTWWFGPVDANSGGRFAPSIFSLRDIAPIGYAAFAFAVGVTAGLLVRRTLPAMAISLVTFIVARIVMQTWIRPNFRTPLKASGPLQPPGKLDLATPTNGPGADLTKPGDWTVSDYIIDPSGHVTNNIRVDPNGSCVATKTCLAEYQHVVTYQPAGRYWAFQWYETSIFLGAAVVLIGFSFWWLRRRLR
jgi:hypothetical protein